MSFYLFNEASFELVASAVAGKINIKFIAFSKIAILFGLSKMCQRKLLPLKPLKYRKVEFSQPGPLSHIYR